MAEYFSGRVTSVRFNNAAQAFYVMDMELENGFKTTVRGTVPGIEVRAGCWFGFEARWEIHQTYGRQLVIERAPIIRGGWNAETALKMLQGHGVGAMVCRHIETHFGDRILDALGNAQLLQEAPGISEFTAQLVVGRWHAVRAMFQSLKFLGDMALPKGKTEQIYAHFGDDAEKILSEDPWALVQIDGITFEQADEVARRLSLDLGSDRRLRGAVLHTCKMRRGLGHIYLGSGEIVQGIQQLVADADKGRIARTLKGLHDEAKLVLDNRTRAGTTAIYEPWFHRLESEAARMLAERIGDATLIDEARAKYATQLATVGPRTTETMVSGADLPAVARSAIEEWSTHGNLRLSEDQMRGAVNALVEPVSILTGLPGTGKTTCLKVVVKVLQDAGVPFLLVAPTGIAAKRITAVTGAEASTIHRAFGAKGVESEDERESTYAGIIGFSSAGVDSDGSNESWSYSNMRPHPAQVVVVDESSMVDQHLLFRLLSCTSRNCRLVFVGDAAQLPSVGPGNVLRDMITLRHFPTVALKEIFRQDEASDIVIAAHAINAGNPPRFSHKSRDFTFVDVRDENAILETLVSTVAKLFERRANFQVLSPRHSGVLGVTNLNLRIRELLNPRTPGLREIRLGSETIREGDRVMVSKNNYRYEIFNGDVGKVVSLDEKAKLVTIKIHGPPVMQVQIPFRDAPSHLRMAYAVTVHKSQGQEYDVILMPWVLGFKAQLQRNLLYTAITRARRKVILIGHPEALERAVMNGKEDTRNTLFPDRLESFLNVPRQCTAG
jgi:exodeoxyribonuclease V alpha subunit